MRYSLSTNWASLSIYVSLWGRNLLFRLMKHLTLVPLGGLCNRLRALLSAGALAELDPELRIRVAWAVNNECAARFDELFEVHLVLSDRIEFRRAGFLDDPAVWRRNLRLPALLRRLLYDEQLPDFHSMSSPADCLARFLDSSRVYISTGSALCLTPPEMWTKLHPLPHIKQRIDSLVDAFRTPTVGVHIRRTDNTKSLSESPLAAFECEMEATIKQDDRVSFYLATDDEEVRKRLVNLFPGRVYFQMGSPTRTTREGMEAAVVDLFVLSRTQRLIGSYWSSFTDTAAELSSIPLTIAQKL